MRNYEQILKSEEKVLYKLRELYRQYGYTQFKMSKFEEYSLYAENKDFLTGNGILTFTNTDGRLMALKPDVTLSIAKNSADLPSVVQKVYYNENVYRISKGTNTFKEILQTGVEAVGSIGAYEVYEVISLAARSLEAISSTYLLDISHMGIVYGLVSELGFSPEDEKAVLACIGEKNQHGVREICARRNIPEALTEKLVMLITAYGDIDTVLGKLDDLVTETSAPAAAELRQIGQALKATGLAQHIRFDFSVINDMSYYNGVVFQGFVEGLMANVLSGGRYDNLMAKLGKSSGAIGFAVDFDILELLDRSSDPYDVDMVLLYDGAATLEQVSKAVKQFTDQGLRVSAQKALPEQIRCRQLAVLEGKEVKILEADD